MRCLPLTWVAKGLPAACLAALCGCVASHADHFYVLGVIPADPGGAHASSLTQASLKVSLPAVVDRPEMTLSSSNDGIVILEHERWAAPLAELVAQTLAADIERRRTDLLVAVPGSTRASAPSLKLAVDLTQVTLRRGQRASIEVQWHILDTRTGKEATGGDVFTAALKTDDYGDVARALSDCLGLLADRLVAVAPQKP